MQNLDAGRATLATTVAWVGVWLVVRGLAGHQLEPALQVQSVTQEHGVVAGASPADVEGRLAVGDKIRILANHSCLTAALFDEYVVVRGAEVVDRWRIHRGR